MNPSELVSNSIEKISKLAQDVPFSEKSVLEANKPPELSGRFPEIGNKYEQTELKTSSFEEGKLPDYNNVEQTSIPDTEDIANDDEIKNTDTTQNVETNNCSDVDSHGGTNDVKEPNEVTETQVKDYIDDLKDKSECPETIDDNAFTAEDLEKTPPDEVAEKRTEFDNNKQELKHDWEIKNGREWPKYTEDVYSDSGKLIRKAGQDYDAHHIQPLSMGGQNEVDNITPIHAKDHYDRQGIHAPDSPYAKIEKSIGGGINAA